MAGVGKTGLAQAFSLMKKISLARLQCYEGIDESKALYECNYEDAGKLAGKLESMMRARNDLTFQNLRSEIE